MDGRVLLRTHVGPMVLFVALCVLWTWPLVGHLRSAIPGNPGDNYNFLWNFWWMRHVLDTPDASYFRMNYLFYPGGTNLVNHSHTALLAFIGATALRSLSIVTALNAILLATVFLNMATMYALTWDLTGHRRAAIISGILFGTSPYLAIRLLGHFELMAVWVLPLFALFTRRALEQGSKGSSIAAGIVLATTAYIAYYYVVYLGLLGLAYLIATSRCGSVAAATRIQSRATVRIRFAAAALLCALAGVALVVTLTGGTVLQIGSATISIRTPQNLLSAAWLATLALASTKWTLAIHWRGIDAVTSRRYRQALVRMGSTFLVGCTPLLVEAAYLVWTRTYATTSVSWRSVPRGIDLLAPLLGHPLNPITGHLTRQAYKAWHLDVMEGMGWVGVVPVALLLWPRRRLTTDDERRNWLTVAAVFAIWAMGPFLTIGGVDTGLKLPELVAQFVPIVSNAHMPGRAIVGVYLALATMVALRLARAEGPLQRARVQWLVIALLIVEYTVAPIPLTTLDVPSVYRQLAREPAGAVCEVPFGIGDGLGPGNIGSQDHAVLYYATVHGHPLVGGYVGRMPQDAAQSYAALPVTRVLLRLSAGESPDATSVPGSEPTAGSPCTYLVLDRAHASSELVAYLQSLPVTLLASSNGRDLFRLDY